MPRVVVASIPGVSSRENEDAVALGDGVAVVVDGAGLPKDLRRGCRHLVRWHAENLATAFRDHLEQRDSDVTAAITDVTGFHGAGCQPDEGSPSATVAAWRVDDDYLVLCDASIIQAFQDGSVAEVTDDRIVRATEPVINEHLRDVQRTRGVVNSDGQAVGSPDGRRANTQPGGRLLVLPHRPCCRARRNPRSREARRGP